MSNDKPSNPPDAPAKLNDLSPVDSKIKAIEEKLALPNPTDPKPEKKTTSPSILGEPQTIDDYLAAMLGIPKK